MPATAGQLRYHAGMDTTILLIGTADGLVNATARGATLQRTAHTLTGRTIEAISALDAETLLVAVVGQGGLQSFDGGATWLPTQTPPEPPGLNAVTRAGPVALANPRLMAATAYAYLGGKRSVLLGAGAGGGMLFRSDDDGIHWEPAALPGPIGRVTCITPDALHAQTAWAGTTDGILLVTTDAGRSWRIAAHESAGILCIVTVTL
jgi:photosystem II stability/assembly factor-like uncharacterized protein